MKIIRYQTEGEAPKYGWMLDDKIGEIQGNLFGEYRRASAMREPPISAPSPTA